jgi:hypothetical protein
MIVSALIKQGCPPTFCDEREYIALTDAANARPASMKPNPLKSMTPLMAACLGGQYETTRMLLSYPEVLQHVNERDCVG